jgi:hypothetical protein
VIGYLAQFYQALQYLYLGFGKGAILNASQAIRCGILILPLSYTSACSSLIWQ